MKKGFTLVELLAVIIILGVLSVLIVPKVINTLNDSEEKTNLASANGLLKAAELKYQDNEIRGISGNILINYPYGENSELLEFSGKKPERGQVAITSEGKIVFAVKIGNTCYIKKASSYDITSKAYDSETCKSWTTFSEDSWDDIKANLIINRNAYALGSEKTMTMNLTGTNVDYVLRLINTESCQSSWTGSETICGVVIEFKNIISNQPMNLTYTNVGGWPASNVYKYLNSNSDSIYNRLPQELKDIIIDTKVISSHGSSDSSNFISMDKLFLLATLEVWGSSYETLNAYDTKQLPYFRDNANERCSRTRATNSISNIGVWWTRSAESTSNENFEYGDTCDYIGEPIVTAMDEYGIIPTFRILD